MANSPFIKAGNFKIRLEDLPEEAWDYIVGGDGNAPDLRKYFRSVAWLNRAVHLRKNHVMNMPFTIYRGETELDTSEDYQNALGFLPNIKFTLGMIEQGLCMNGAEYMLVDRNLLGGVRPGKGLRHLVASNVKPKYAKKAEKGIQEGQLIGFERNLNGKVVPLDVEDVLYFWLQDDSVEIGPPQDWPALAALQAAGVLYSIANFAGAFFDRGLIKTTLFYTKGPVVEAERRRFKGLLERLKAAMWSTDVLNADEVGVLPIGEGLENLNNSSLTTEQREDISTALGVPHSMLFSNAANYATSQQDKLNFYEDTIIPDCEFISGIINEQVLEPMGYRLVFNPQELAIFQEDEEQRSAAFYNYVASGVRPSIAGEVLGMDLPEGIEFSDLDEKYEKSLEMQEQLAQGQQPGDASDDIAEGNNPRQQEKGLIAIDLDKWQRKALKRIQKGYDPACTFESEHIPLVTLAAIEGALESTTNKADLVRDLFKNVELGWVPYP